MILSSNFVLALVPSRIIITPPQELSELPLIMWWFHYCVESPNIPTCTTLVCLHICNLIHQMNFGCVFTIIYCSYFLWCSCLNYFHNLWATKYTFLFSCICTYDDIVRCQNPTSYNGIYNYYRTWNPYFWQILTLSLYTCPEYLILVWYIYIYIFVCFNVLHQLPLVRDIDNLTQLVRSSSSTYHFMMDIIWQINSPFVKWVC